MGVRIQSASISNFKNVSYGEIRFPCSFNSDIFAAGADVLGIYGQNGSGKTTFINVLDILKRLLSSQPFTEQIDSCRSKGSQESQLTFEFSVTDEQGHKFRVIYSAQIGLEYLNESIKASAFQNGAWTRMNIILATNSADERVVISPDAKRKELFGVAPKTLPNLRMAKIICAREQQSFLFSDALFNLISQESADAAMWKSMLSELRNFGRVGLFVISNRGSGLISLEAGQPFNFRTEKALGQFALPLDKSIVLPIEVYTIANQVIGTINMVLREIIPGMEISLSILEKVLMDDGTLGVCVQLVRTALESGSGEAVPLPLRQESEGIKKIISIMHLFICAYNKPDITLAIDELDAGIFEYLLGELLQIMQHSGQGQLIFTSHNLHPLETLDNLSIVFTTTNPKNRYVRESGIKASNNLRLVYFRDITLGGDEEDLYQETNSFEIAHALRKANTLDRDIVKGVVQEHG